MSATSEGHRARILVVGCGGIGGVVAASLLEQGHDVTPLTRNEHIAEAINRRGFEVRGELAPGPVAGRAVTRLGDDVAPFDWILLCTQPPQVEEAARQVLPHLRDDGAFVCLQNGLCELRVQAIAGRERTLGAIVAWGASMIEPGVYDRTSAGGFVLGALEAPGARAMSRERLESLARVLEAVGPVDLSNNLLGARWSKLAINCAISSLGTVGGERLGVLMRQRFIRRLTLETMTETVAVARAEGVRLEKVSGTLDLDWVALTEAEQRARVGSPALVAKHGLLLAVGARYRRLRSSMLNAIERGRPVSVDFLNGEVISAGRRHGIATPINVAIYDAVQRVADGKDKPSMATARALYERTRHHRGPALQSGVGADG